MKGCPVGENEVRGGLKGLWRLGVLGRRRRHRQVEEEGKVDRDQGGRGPSSAAVSGFKIHDPGGRGVICCDKWNVKKGNPTQKEVAWRVKLTLLKPAVVTRARPRKEVRGVG